MAWPGGARPGMARQGSAGRGRARQTHGVETPRSFQNDMTDEQLKELEPGDWPIWRIALRRLRALESFGYGMQLDTAWFEAALSAKRESNDFGFAMMELRAELENEDGYYLQCQTIQDQETGLRREVWQIPAAAEHETVARQFEGKMRRFSHRALAIRLKTLANASAHMSDAERTKMESSSRIAATRLVLLQREKSIAAAVRKHAPKLLESPKKQTPATDGNEHAHS